VPRPRSPAGARQAIMTGSLTLSACALIPPPVQRRTPRPGPAHLSGTNATTGERDNGPAADARTAVPGHRGGRAMTRILQIQPRLPGCPAAGEQLVVPADAGLGPGIGGHRAQVLVQGVLGLVAPEVLIDGGPV